MFFFINPSDDGYLDCFHILAIVNSAAINIRVCVSFWISAFIFLVIYPGVEVLDHTAVKFLVCLGTILCFPYWQHQFTFPQVYKGCFFYIILPTLLFVDIFSMAAILTDMRRYHIGDLVCISLIIKNADNIFLCLFTIYMFYLEKNLYSGYLLIFI